MHEYRYILESQKHKWGKKKVADETSCKKFSFTLHAISTLFIRLQLIKLTYFNILAT